MYVAAFSSVQSEKLPSLADYCRSSVSSTMAVWHKNHNICGEVIPYQTIEFSQLVILNVVSLWDPTA